MADFYFTSDDDDFTGTETKDLFYLTTSGGMDRIDGRGGSDSLLVGLSGGNIAIDLEAGFAAVGLTILPGDWVPGGEGTTLELSSIEQVDLVNPTGWSLIRGDAQDNILNSDYGKGELYGGAGNDRLYSSGGDVSLFGGDGDDRLFADTNVAQGPVRLSGGPGTDTFVTPSTPNGIELSDLAVSLVENGLLLSSGANRFTVLDDVEFLELTDFNEASTLLTYAELEAMARNVVTGTDAGEVLYGSDDPDSIDALAGDDLIFGSPSDDTLSGGDGWDMASYANLSGTGVRVIQGSGGTTVSSFPSFGFPSFRDELTGIESITGTSQADRFEGAGDVYFRGLGGRDSMTFEGGPGFFDGGASRDSLDFRDSSEGVNVSLLRGRGWEGDAAGARFRNVENLLGGHGDDTLTGDGGDNYLFSYAGDDTLIGTAGDDYLNGGLGTDTAVYFYNEDQYVITREGFRTVVDYIGPGEGDGTDVLAHFEILRFADGDVIL